MYTHLQIFFRLGSDLTAAGRVMDMLHIALSLLSASYS